MKNAIVKKLNIAKECAEIAKASLEAAVAAVEEFEAGKGFLELVSTEEGCWVSAVAKTAEETYASAVAKVAAAEAELTAYEKAARERRWGESTRSTARRRRWLNRSMPTSIVSNTLRLTSWQDSSQNCSLPSFALSVCATVYQAR